MGDVRIPDDLDPADTAIRQALIDRLRMSRQDRGIMQSRVADQLGISGPAVHSLERRITWEARTIARYSRAIGWRIHWTAYDLAIPDDGDVMAIIIAAGDTSTPEREDRVAWLALCNDLVRVRRATCSAVEMARRAGLADTTVHDWEANPLGSTITAAQRHARALGGYLGWQLEKTAAPGAAPGPRRAG